MTNAAVCVASAVNVLSGGEAMNNLYVDIMNGSAFEPHDPVQDQKDAQEIKMRIMGKVNALKEVNNGGYSV